MRVVTKSLQAVPIPGDHCAWASERIARNNIASKVLAAN